MTLAEQIKNAVTAALSDLRAALVKPPATPDTAAASPAAPSSPATPSAGTSDPCSSVKSVSDVTDQVRAEITTAVKAALEPINSELTQARADLATAKQTIGSLQGQVTAKDTEITDLKATIANPKGKIETLASTKAAEIAGSQGCAALPANPPANPAAAANANATAGLKGRARLEAAIAAQTKSA